MTLPAITAINTGAKEPTPLSGDAWSFVALPDTQHYAEDLNGSGLAYGKDQTAWIRDNLDAQNIAFVSHEGDMVERGEVLEEWQNISDVMDTIHGLVPYATVPGNHDWEPDPTLTYPRTSKTTSIDNYRNHFGPSRFSDVPFDHGFGPKNGGTNANINSYQLFSAGGYEFLHLGLEWEPAGSVDDPSTPLGWAQSILNRYPDRPTIVTTHSWLRDLKAANGYQDRTPRWQLQSDDGNAAQDVWQSLVKKNDQIFMVVSGHWYRMAKYPDEKYHAGEGHQVSTNEAGNPVYEVFADYQWKENGGDGWLRLIRFLPGGGSSGQDRIHVQTFTPSLTGQDGNPGKFQGNDGYTEPTSDFAFDLDFASRFPSRDTSLPTPWHDRDVGKVAADGSASGSGGTFTVTGSGATIYGTADEFHYVYQGLTGDGEIVANVTSLENQADPSSTSPYAKAGVMIRETMGDGSRNAFMRVDHGYDQSTGNGGTDFQYRTTPGGSTDAQSGDDTVPPAWVKLVREGDTFTGYQSIDGSNWTEVGSQIISMATDVYVGLAVTSNDDGTLCTGTFESVKVSPSSSSTTSTPRIDTNAATDLTDTGATLNGTLVSRGGASAADVWFTYWPDGDPSAATETDHQTLTSIGTFDVAVSGLASGTTYVVQAHVDNGSDAADGAQRQFTTTGQSSTPTTGDVNEDGTIDDQDVTDVQEYIAGKQPDSATFNATRADVNGDGDVDIVDAMGIRNNRTNGGSN